MYRTALLTILSISVVSRSNGKDDLRSQDPHCCGEQHELRENPEAEIVRFPEDLVTHNVRGDPRGGFTDKWNPSTPSTPPKGRILNQGLPPVTDNRGTGDFRPIELPTRMGIIIGNAEFTEQPTSPPSTGRTFFAFRGIPYAIPPIGRLRFRETRDFDGPWPGGRLDATQHRSFCPQYDHDTNQVVGNEDCLYLNVYTPVVPDQARVRLPVLVFLHGGSYMRDTAASLGPRKLLREDVVLVTVNFRLGILGFLSTRDEYLPGNYGLLDQLAALRWVQRNIAQFGGDPNRVTLGGFSSGASAVHLHMLSPLSRGLFSGAIMMSGAGNCVWSVSEEPEDAAYLVGYHLDCSTWSSWYLRECLMDKTTEELIQAQAENHKFVIWPMLFRPVVDAYFREEPFLPDTVPELMSRPALNPVPLLIGGVPDEGMLYALTVTLFSKNTGSSSQIYEEDLRYTLESLWPYYNISNEAIESISKYYYSPQAKENLQVLTTEMSEAFTDLFFTSCIWDAAKYFASSSRVPVFTYLMNHRLPTSPSFSGPLYLLAESAGLQARELYTRVSHGDDLALIFSLPFDVTQPSADDQQMSSLLTFIWATFTHTGAPLRGNGAAISGLPQWPPLVAGEPVNHYSLSFSPGPSLEPFRHKERNFWSSTLLYIDEISWTRFYYFIATWILLCLCLLLLLFLLVVCICVWRARRKNKYPGSSLTLRKRIARNPSSSSGDSRAGASSNPRT